MKYLLWSIAKFLYVEMSGNVENVEKYLLSEMLGCVIIQAKVLKCFPSSGCSRRGLFMTIVIIVLFLLLLAVFSLLLGVYIMTRKDLRRTRFKVKIPKIYEVEFETEVDEKHKKK